ncbi:MAG: PDZ domain-containing protein [Deltaproteobacteria bacterium]
MKRRTGAVMTGILVIAALGATALLAQKILTPRPLRAETPSDEKAVKVESPKRVHKMVFLGDSEGAWLGVSVADVTSEKAKELKLPGEYGAVVEEVNEDSPAARAGIKKGDVILQFAGEKVRSVAELRRLVRETPAGRTVAIEINRNGSTQNLSAKIAETPEPKMFSHSEGLEGTEPQFRVFKMPNVHIPSFDFNMMFTGTPRLGISGEELTSQLAGYFGVWGGKGVLVREVKDGTPAQKAGLKAGDVITKVNDKAVASIEELRGALASDSKEKYSVTLTIVRDRKEQAVKVELEPAKHLISPEEVTELRGQIVNPEKMRLLKDQIRAQMAEITKNAEQMKLQKEKIRDEVERSMRLYRKDLEQFQKNYRKEIDQLRDQKLRFDWSQISI